MTTTTIEYDQWLYVRTDTAAQAREFFGVPANWPVKLDAAGTLRNGGAKVWRVLSPGWVKQQNERKR